MAIERLKKVIVISPKNKKGEVLEKFFSLGTVHLESFEYSSRELGGFVKPIPQKTYTKEISQLNFIKNIFTEFGFQKKGFFKSFFPEDVEVTEEQVLRVVDEFDLDRFYESVASLYSRYSEISEEENRLKEERKAIFYLKNFPFELEILNGTERTYSLVLRFRNLDLARFLREESDLRSRIYVETFETEKNFSKVFVLLMRDDLPYLEEELKRYKVERFVTDKHFVGFVEEEVERITRRLSDLSQEKKIITSKLREMSGEHLSVQILSEYYLLMNDKEKAISNFIESESLVLSKGYVKSSQVKELLMGIESKDTYVMISDPEPDDFVPVALKNNLIFRPFEFLVRLFGVPSYGNIDPTPLVAMLFSVFFGIALGDAFYGLALALFGCIFAVKYRKNLPARNFFSIMLYGGVMSIVVGLLTGSCAGNFFSTYFPNSFLTKSLSLIQVIDTNSPSGSVSFLVFAIGLGILSQLLGVLMSVIVKIRQKDVLNALFNGVGWLLFLPGLILMFFVRTFPYLRTIDNIILYTGLAFLLLGGWISVRSLIFKPIAALVNLYGIRSSYGITSFLGDALSYSRLFALGLSSSILASSFNLMARAISDMFGSFGIVPLVVILLATHGLTLVMNVLGSFIHSMRLNFLEFFGRFYDIGSYEFKPFGLSFRNIRIEQKREAK